MASWPHNSQNLPPLAPGWTEHKAPTGHTYYYNASTKTSTYTRPQAPQAPVGLAPASAGLLPKPQGLPPRPDGSPMGNYPPAPGSGPVLGYGFAPGGFGRGGYPQVPAGYGRGGFGGGHFPPGHGGRGRGSFHRGGAHSSFQQRQRRGLPQNKADRPKTKREIPDAHPWVLVTTSQGNRFVHNLETKVSLYTPPDGVMKAMEKMKFLTIDEERQLEKERVTKKKLEKAAVSEHRPQAVEQDNGEGYEAFKAPGGLDGEGSMASRRPAAAFAEEDEEEIEEEDDEDYYDEDEDMDEHDYKRLKTNEGGAVEFGEDDIAWQMRAMAEEFGLDEQDLGEDDGDDLTAEESVKMFKEMLNDLNVNPYSTWEKEMPQMVEDGRYVLLPNTKKRKEVFGEWSRDRMAQLKAEKEKQVKVDPRIPYLRFLETNATPKLYWPEFKRKFKKEPEMKDIKVTDKDREKYYRDYITRTKASIETRESDLRKLLKSTAGLARDTTDLTLPSSISCDIRYVAVPRDRREEILADYVKTLPEDGAAAAANAGSNDKMTEEERRQKALRDRAEAVRRGQRRVNYQVRQGKEMLRESEMEIQKAMEIEREGVLTHLQSGAKKDNQD